MKPGTQNTQPQYPCRLFCLLAQKSHPHGQYVLLRKDIYEYKTHQAVYPFNCYEFTLKDRINRRDILFADVNWAELDQRQRLVFTKNDGCLYVDELQQTRLSPRLIANLNDQHPQSIRTPEWATTWDEHVG